VWQGVRVAPHGDYPSVASHVARDSMLIVGRVSGRSGRQAASRSTVSKSPGFHTAPENVAESTAAAGSGAPRGGGERGLALVTPLSILVRTLCQTIITREPLSGASPPAC
jgi:hypothetical protein